MPTKEEKRLFAELKRRGVAVSPDLLKEQSDFDSSAGTSSVSPASPPGGLADYSPSGRGNPSERSGGINMPPKVSGASAAPSPPQITGSNLPGSMIHQLPPVTQQYPGQVIAIPQNLLASSKDAQEPDEAPIGSPRTAGGQAANDPKVLAKALAAQLKTPVVMPGRTEERSYTDPSRASPFASPLMQPVPMDHQHAATILQQPIPTPSSQVARYPGDFNKPIPLQPKADASDSDGVQKHFPPGFLDANVPKKRIISQVVESKGE